LEQFHIQVGDVETTISREDFRFSSPMKCAINNMVNHLDGHENLKVTGCDATSVMRTIAAAYKSHESFQKTKLFDLGEYSIREYESRSTSLTRDGKIH
jgi:uncharacterized protein YbbC (DUF1343 family)